MTDLAISALVVLILAGLTPLLGLVYFRRYSMKRPPIGVFNLRDVLFTFAMIIIVPFLYIVPPLWFSALLFGFSGLSLLYLVFEPTVTRRRFIWLLSLGLAGVDALVCWSMGGDSPAFLVTNNLLVILCVIGMANVWAQSGLSARNTAIFGGLLAVYDFIATAQLPLMGDLLRRLANLPFAPVVAWGSGTNVAAIGLGDLALATLFPLVMRKAFGPVAGYSASGLGFCAILAMFILPPGTLFPAMVVLGPLMLAEYFFWHTRQKQERTTREYLEQEPLLVFQA